MGEELSEITGAKFGTGGWPVEQPVYTYTGTHNKDLYIRDPLSEEQRAYIKLECLRMAVQHATPDQAKDGTVYKIADDYYNYVTNKTK